MRVTGGSAPTFLHPKTLLGTKWTAVMPRNREKHFVVVAVVEPEVPGQAAEFVDLEAVYSHRLQRLAWRDLKDGAVWRQGWC